MVYSAAIERFVNNSVIDYIDNAFNRGFYITGSGSCYK